MKYITALDEDGICYVNPGIKLNKINRQVLPFSCQ